MNEQQEAIAAAERRRDNALRNFGSRIRNGATSGSLAFRRSDEQEYRIACDTLRALGVGNALKRKYRVQG